MATITDAALPDLLALQQWLSPAYPVSAYAWSQGLERAIAAGDVPDAAALEAWVRDVLAHGQGWTDAVFLARAREAEGETLAGIAELAAAFAPARERLAETREQGAAFARTTAALTGRALPAMPYPVAVGAASRALSLPTATVAALYLQAGAGALVSAAVRFVPLGQTEGQRVLARLHPLIERLAADAAAAPLDAAGGCAFRADIASMQHETMKTRIFRS